MEHKDFLEKTIMTFDVVAFETAKRNLIGEYLNYEFVNENDITKALLAEKTNDYFVIVEQKTFKTFDKLVAAYTKNLRSIVVSRVAETPKPKKNDTASIEVPRARKYYEKAQSIIDLENLTVGNLIDYTRIMMCLYMSIIENDYKTIDNFDFSADSLDISIILNALKNEKGTGAKKLLAKPFFNTEEPFNMDTCTFIFVIILLQTIFNERG